MSKTIISGSDFFSQVLRDMKNVYQVVELIKEKESFNKIKEDEFKNILHLFLEDKLYGEILSINQDELMIRIRNAFDNLQFKININDYREKAIFTYRIIFNKYYNNLGHYFRHLYHILKYINDNEIKEEAYVFIDLKTKYDKDKMSSNKLLKYKL